MATVLALAALIGAAIAEALHSRVQLPDDPLLTASLQMLAGGVALVAAALAADEPIVVRGWTAASILSMLP